MIIKVFRNDETSYEMEVPEDFLPEEQEEESAETEETEETAAVDEMAEAIEEGVNDV